MTKGQRIQLAALSQTTLLDSLDAQVFEHKQEIRRHKEELRTVASERDRVREQLAYLKQLGVDVEQKAQGITHGRPSKQEATDPRPE